MNDTIKELAEPLTNLQRLTVINLIGGMSQRQAYLTAGGKAKTETAQDSSVSKMLTNDKVRSYYEAMLEQAQVESVMSKTEALNILSDQARVKENDPATVRNIQTAIKTLAGFLGWESPTKTSVANISTIELVAGETKQIKDYTDGELLAMIAGE